MTLQVIRLLYSDDYLQALLSMISPLMFNILKLTSFTSEANKFITNMVEMALALKAVSPAGSDDFIKGMLKLIETNEGMISI